MRRRHLKLLYRSLDADLTARDKARLSAALEASEELRRTRDEILAIRRAAGETAAEGFRPGFADRTLAAIRAGQRGQNPREAFLESLKTVFKPLAVAAAVLLVILVTYNVTHGDLIPKGEIYYASDLALGKILQVSSF
jgi:hypothetical protein